VSGELKKNIVFCAFERFFGSCRYQPNHLSLLAGVLTEVLFEDFFFIETFQDFIIAGSICPYRIE
jgi:hypothetical protein